MIIFRPILPETLSDSSLPQLQFHRTNDEKDGEEKQEKETNDFVEKIELIDNSEHQVVQKISHVVCCFICYLPYNHILYNLNFMLSFVSLDDILMNLKLHN